MYSDQLFNYMWLCSLINFLLPSLSDPDEERPGSVTPNQSLFPNRLASYPDNEPQCCVLPFILISCFLVLSLSFIVLFLSIVVPLLFYLILRLFSIFSLSFLALPIFMLVLFYLLPCSVAYQLFYPFLTNFYLEPVLLLFPHFLPFSADRHNLAIKAKAESRYQGEGRRAEKCLMSPRCVRLSPRIDSFLLAASL